MSFTQNNNQISQLETILNSEQINQFPKKDSTDDDETINSYNESENQFKKLQMNTQFQKEVTIPSNKSSLYDGLNDFKKSPTKKNQDMKQSGLNTLKSLPLYAKYVVFYEEERPNINYETQIIEIKLELPHECSINDCITESLAMFNEKLEQMNQNQLPLDNISNYQLFMAKNNGQRKPDYPAFDREQSLVNTHVQKFNLRLLTFPQVSSDKSLNVVDYVDINNANNSFSSSNMIYRDSKSSSAQTTQTIPLSSTKFNETLDCQLLPPSNQENQQQKGGFFKQLCCVCFPISQNKNNNNTSIQQLQSLQK